MIIWNRLAGKYLDNPDPMQFQTGLERKEDSLMLHAKRMAAVLAATASAALAVGVGTVNAATPQGGFGTNNHVTLTLADEGLAHVDFLATQNGPSGKGHWQISVAGGALVNVGPDGRASNSDYNYQELNFITDSVAGARYRAIWWHFNGPGQGWTSEGDVVVINS